MQNKAKIVYEKIAQLDATAEGAKKIYNYLTKRLIKNYAKHGHKGGLKGFYNDELLSGARDVSSLPQPHNQQIFKNIWKETKSNMKNFFKK